MKLVIIRRPETNKNAGLASNQEAPSPKGEEQLAHIAEVCRNENVQAVIHSVEPRAALAAQVLAQTLEVPTVAQEDLEERDFGDWSGWEWPQISAELEKLTAEERYTFTPPNGESWQLMEERLRSTLRHIATLNYDSVAIMTHWGPVRVLLPIARGESKESTLRLDVANGQSFVEEYADV